MADKKPFYLTTTLPYVNDKPHMGHALEFVHADIIARYQRLMDRDVFFNTGTDEHGQKISQKAQEQGQEVQAYVDHYAEQFKNLKTVLGLSYDAFIRTTDPAHVAAAQELWRRCEAKGDIYKKKYKGLYCVGDEAFIKESDLVDGKCPNHPGMTPIEIEEENYFFRLSAYQDKLLAYLNGDVILPQWRKEEAIKFVQGGLEDFSISREKARMSWGIAVPGDDAQVMYVWFDALTNYISTLGWPADTEGKFKKFWASGEVVQMAGKDQVRFQSIMWQAMLMSADIKNTNLVVYHGFITSEGQKMSKSIGNVIDPLALVEEYGTDALRYFLARHISSFEDSDFTIARFKAAYNADLANGLGNLAARIMQLAQTHLSAPVVLPTLSFDPEYIEHMEKFEISKALDLVWERIRLLDQQITDTQPFKVVKTNPEEGKELISALVLELAQTLMHLWPVIPAKGHEIWTAIKENKKPETLFPRKE
jgi:methionyl-tRNA synthetase